MSNDNMEATLKGMIRSKQAKDRIQQRVTKAAETRKKHIVQSGKAFVPHNRKYDWPIIKGLYMAGMQPEDLLKLPECQGMSKEYLYHRIGIDKWAVERKNLAKKRAAEIGSNLQERMKRATEDHYIFMLKQIEDEREIITHRLKTTRIEDQQARLDLLADFEQLARKTLGLDDMSPNDPNKNSFNAMIVIQNLSAPQKASGDGSATLPLLSDKKVTTVNSVRSRGISGETVDAEFQVDGQEGEQEGQAEGQNLSPNDNQAASRQGADEDRRTGAEELLKSWRLGMVRI